MLIDKPIKNENCEVLRSGLLNIQVCSCLSEEETLRWLRRASPAGTSMNWGMQKKDDKDYLSPVKCGDDSERWHYIFVC